LENFIKVTEGWDWLGAELIVLREMYICGCDKDCKEPKKCPKKISTAYGGTADGLAKLPNGMTVITDVKTSSGVYPEHDLQVAMYAYATPTDDSVAQLWSNIEEARILHFDKKLHTWEVLERDIESQRRYIPHFCACYDWKRKFANK
jgi:hypothetical protein